MDAAAFRRGERNAKPDDECRRIFSKTLTERLSPYSQGSWLQIGRVDTESLYGFGNFENGFKYLAISDHDRELLLTLGVNSEWGATGTSRTAASKGATEPRLYFGKGLGDLDIGYLSADSRPRPDLIRAGFAVQYSIPCLQSKVQSFDLPPLVRGLTPMADGTAAVRSTDWFVEASPGAMQVGVLNGMVAMTSGATGASIAIPERWGARLEAGRDPVPPRLWGQAEFDAVIARTGLP